MAAGELYKGVWIKSGNDFYKPQNPTVYNELKSVIDKVFGGGTSANRPTSATAQTGEQYFDTDYGIPIWWNGTAWQNVSGITSAVN